MAKDGDPKAAHPVEANGMGSRVNGGNYGDIFDNHFVEFTYADGSKLFSQSRHIPDTWVHGEEYVHGTKGHSKGEPPQGPKARMRQSVRSGTCGTDQGDPQGHAAQRGLAWSRSAA